MGLKRPGSTASPLLNKSQYETQRAKQHQQNSPHTGSGSYQTQDTLPVPRDRSFHHSSSPVIPNSPQPQLQSSPYITQPTQPWQQKPYVSPSSNNTPNSNHKRKRTESPERSQSSVVQVPASSPLRNGNEQRSIPAPRPGTYSGIQPANGLKRPRPGMNGGMNGIGSSIAPPGTSFRSPYQSAPVPARAQMTQPRRYDDDEGVVALSSDDEDAKERRRNGDIPVSKPAISTSGGIGDLLAQFGHTEPAGRPASAIARRQQDAMASGYTQSRAPRERVPLKTSAQVKEKEKEKELSMQDVDVRNRPKVEELLGMFPGVSIGRCDKALANCHGDVGMAMNDLAGWQESEKRKKAAANAVDLTGIEFEDDDVDELSDATKSNNTSQSQPLKRPNQKATSKVIAANKMSIKDKYAKNPAGPRHALSPLKEAIPVPSSPEKIDTPPPPVRRRLIQGRRRSATPEEPLSPVVAPPARAAAQNARRRLVESDDEEESEVEAEAVETDDEEATANVDEAIDLTNDSTSLEGRLLDMLNTCSVAALVDLSRQPHDVAEAVINRRPFSSLDDVRAITIDSTSVTKAGKTRVTKKKIGERFTEVCLEMSEGYEAVDQLVEQCEEIAKPITAEMKSMGIDLASLLASGELSFTDVDNDSGIGTPCSSIADDDVKPGSRRTPALAKPSIMSKDVVLKDYQIAGLNWLALMWKQKLSCILADDMGLGKTCQVVSFVSHLVEVGHPGPHLIIVPGSTLENWLREFNNFSPNVAVAPYYGSLAERGEAREEIPDRIAEGQLNVVVTTYEMAKGRKEDTSFLKNLRPVLCVFDEGHALKNSSSQRYQELMRIPAKMRLLLTGTPLQNNLQELISLLAFIMPRLFSEHSESLAYIFKHKAKVADAADALLSQERIMRARSMMAPFVLRRKKEQVLKHIPKKTCRVEYCDMTPEQATVYNAEGIKVRAILDERAAAKAAGQKPWVVKGSANNLMRLRQAAIHPLLLRHHFTDAILQKMVKACHNEDDFRLLTKDKDKRIFESLSAESDYNLHQFCQHHSNAMRFDMFGTDEKEEAAILNSGKVAKLLELLLKFKANGDRTLVFSKFTMTLDILELVLSAHSLRFCRLDGSTPMEQRQVLIDQFQNDTENEIPVFMLSTGAGGAGINLAAANKVVIFDMSFNPQDDIQAENRAHRVGQTREVEVVRLVSRGTVEEQIHRLGETKLALDERVAGSGGGSGLPADAGEAEAEQAGASRVLEMMLGDLEGKKEEDVKKEDIKAEAGMKQEAEDKSSVKKEKTEDVDMADAYAASLAEAGLNVKIDDIKKE